MDISVANLRSFRFALATGRAVLSRADAVACLDHSIALARRLNRLDAAGDVLTRRIRKLERLQSKHGGSAK